jgi:hypothetical protein
MVEMWPDAGLQDVKERLKKNLATCENARPVEREDEVKRKRRG